MPGQPLRNHELIAFVATTNPERAKKFYSDVLGLRLVQEELPFALVYDANGTILRVTIVPKIVLAGYTVLGWAVEDIDASARELAGLGVGFQRYPGLEQDDLGIWSAPGGAKVAWFQDPDGNTLSISQH